MSQANADRVRRASALAGTSRLLALASLLVASGMVVSGVWHAGALPDTLALPVSVPLSFEDRSTTADETVGDNRDALAAVIGVNALSDPPGYLRVPRPQLSPGPRRVGIQAGHWKTAEAPPELRRVVTQTGTTWGPYTEWETNLNIAERVAALLRPQGVVVDVLPTTIPEGYVADAFVALHADGDGTGENSGFKMAHGSRRGPYEDALQKAIAETYAAETGLAYDGLRVTRAMSNYYAQAWTRFRHATSPHTPSVILEMGYLSANDDRELLVDEPDVVAVGIANGILNFLNEHPRSELFGKDLLVAPAPIFRPRSPISAAP